MKKFKQGDKLPDQFKKFGDSPLAEKDVKDKHDPSDDKGSAHTDKGNK